MVKDIRVIDEAKRLEDLEDQEGWRCLVETATSLTDL